MNPPDQDVNPVSIPQTVEPVITDADITTDWKTRRNQVNFTFTPALSRYILEHLGFKNNRPSNEAKRAYLALNIKDGKFKDNGDSIKFDINGRLIDGHTRLSACVAANTSFTTSVAFGLQPEVINWIDDPACQTLRTGGAQIIMQGGDKKTAALENETIKLSLRYFTNRNKASISNHEILAYREKYHHELAVSLQWGQKAAHEVKLTASTGAFLHHIGTIWVSQQEAIKTTEFFACLCEGKGTFTDADDPRTKFKHLLAQKRGGKQKFNTPYFIAAGLFALRAFIEGNTISKFPKSLTGMPRISANHEKDFPVPEKKRQGRKKKEKN